MSALNEHRLTNPQVALICATEMDPGAYQRPDGDERTDRVLARAHQFLAFLESADAETTDTPARG